MPVLVGLRPIGTVRGLPTKRLKRALEATLEISEGEGVGPYLCVCCLSGHKDVPGVEAAVGVHWLWLRLPGVSRAIL